MGYFHLIFHYSPTVPCLSNVTFFTLYFYLTLKLKAKKLFNELEKEDGHNLRHSNAIELGRSPANAIGPRVSRPRLDRILKNNVI